MIGKPLVVLGSVNADHILQVKELPRPGETVTGHGYRVVPGGKGANQAVAAVRLGARTAFIACVGEDDFGRRMKDAFQAKGMDTRGIMVEEGMPTGMAMIFVAENGENCIGISPEANACLTPERLAPHLGLIRGASALLMQMETPMETVIMAAEEAKKAGVPVALNPAPARSLPEELLKNLAIITPNETEAAALTGIAIQDAASAMEAAACLHGMGVATVIITLGAKGAFVSAKGRGAVVPGFHVTPVDTTAAGDTFNGALMAALQRGDQLPEAIAFSHAAAALSVMRMGAQTSIPTRKEAEDFLRAQR
ncbi:ribokinase [Desulfoluna spongiiphila]|uniref:Ribokinase n=1 Tax=Desulfoluna spongiiphila TaxID=419481 RepID=A0A1G5C5K7_9BACT|nr:ribokinase [Desulfoluna spongiiphila]SCX97735.1 ribokinase [Desulfoluna spongiiphila]